MKRLLQQHLRGTEMLFSKLLIYEVCHLWDFFRQSVPVTLCIARANNLVGFVFCSLLVSNCCVWTLGERTYSENLKGEKKVCSQKKKYMVLVHLFWFVFTSIIWTTLVSRHCKCLIILIVHCQGVHFISLFSGAYNLVFNALQ